MSDGLMMKYFVLKPKGDDVFAKASRRAMRAYADTIHNENPTFANELRAWADNEQIAHHERTGTLVTSGGV
jgi:hypothetical protein